MPYIDNLHEHRLAINGEEQFFIKSSGRTIYRCVCLCGAKTAWAKHPWLASLLFEQHVIRETQLTMSREEVQSRLAAIKAKETEAPF